MYKSTHLPSFLSLSLPFLHPLPLQLVRFPTPFRRDMKNKKKKLTKYKPDAIPSTTIFKKGTSQVWISMHCTYMYIFCTFYCMYSMCLCQMNMNM